MPPRPIFITQEATMKAAKSITIASALLATLLAAGCNRNDTTAQDAGRKVDQAQENAAQQMDQASNAVKEQAADAGAKIDDAAITVKVKSALIGEPNLKALKINVDTANGVVTLSGTVDAPASIDRATQVAQAVEGVKSVDNRLTVGQG
jgi:hyperosmotically inducible periplasmic protein